MEDWAEIRRLHRAEGMPVKVIARVMGVSRNTVRSAIASDRPPKYQRPAKGSIVDAAEPRIRELLKAYPTMPATVIAERIGWERSIRVLRDRVAELRPAYLPPDPASRTAYAAGEIAQCDLWFPPVMVPVGFGQVRKPTQLPVLTMVCAYSRWLVALMEVRALAAHEPAIAAAVRAADARTHEQLEGLIAAGIAAGEWPPEADPALAARLFTAGLYGLMAQWHLAPGSFSWNAAAAALADSS